MPELFGHLAMGLLFALVGWVLWDGRTALAFVAFVLTTSMLPDIDLVLQEIGLPVKHHGVLHTVVFVVGFAVVAGFVAVTVLRPVLQRWWRLTEDETVQKGTVYLFVTAGFALGGLSHVFADTLAVDSYEQVEPLWPFVEEPIELGLVHYSSPWINVGLLVVGVALHLAVVASGSFPVEHRYRRWTDDLAETGSNS